MKKLISIIAVVLMSSLLSAQTLVIGGKTVKMGPKWTPANTATRAWFDASDTNSITLDIDGESVTGWVDQSTNGYDVTQSNGGNQPTSGTTTINGLNAIEFTTDGHYLRNTNSLFEAGEAYSLAVMVYMNSSSNYCAIVDGVGSIATRGFLNPTSATSIRYLGNNNGGMAPSFNRQVGGLIVTVIANDTNSRLVFNGTANAGTINISNGMTAGLTVGGNIGGGFNMDGAIGEIIYSRGAWDVATRQKVEGYLAWKWGARHLLYASHPYKHTHPQNDAEAKVVTP